MTRAPVVCALLLVLNLAAAQASTPAILAEFDTYLDQTAGQLGDSPFAAVVSRDGVILYERYDDGNGVLGRPVNRDSRWQVFSITKSFAAALVLGLCHDRIFFGLNEPVGKHLPAFREHGPGPFDRRSVRLWHLMSHTSGAAVAGDKAPEILPPDMESVGILTEPGTEFRYSGLGMLILERVVEVATGEDFGTLLQERISGPLRLDSTGYVYSGASLDRVLPLKPGQFHYSQNGMRASAGLYTTARDLNAFGRFWLHHEAMFSTELRRKAWTHHGTRASDGGRYGLLWWLFEDAGGYVMSGKESKINAVIPETGVVITVIRYPQARPAQGYSFIEDKRTLVRFGQRLGTRKGSE